MPKLSEMSGGVVVEKAETTPVRHEDKHPFNESGMDTPFDLDVPSYLMCRPYTISVKNKNNVWMKDADQQEPIDYDRAFAQWQVLYNFIAGQADVWQLPPSGSYQDQVYVANLAMIPPHLDNMVLLANMKSPPRKGEEWVGEAFFKMMKFDVSRPPYTWEGNAETKWLHDNVYIGGYGQRTDIRTYDWMEKEHDMRVIRVEMTDERLYHIDCSVFNLSDEKAMICTSVFDKKEIKAIEKEVEIIDVPLLVAYKGACNCVRLGTHLLCASGIATMDTKDKDYGDMKKHQDFLMDVCIDNGLSLSLFDLGELEKSGAALSCCVLALNEKAQGHEEVL